MKSKTKLHLQANKSVSLKLIHNLYVWSCKQCFVINVYYQGWQDIYHLIRQKWKRLLWLYDTSIHFSTKQRAAVYIDTPLHNEIVLLFSFCLVAAWFPHLHMSVAETQVTRRWEDEFFCVWKKRTKNIFSKMKLRYW